MTYHQQQVAIGKLMLKRNLTSVQCQMAWILFRLNGFRSAAKFARGVEMIDQGVLDEFRARYGVEFSRETFAQREPDANGMLVLSPDRIGDPLPPVGCRLKIHGYGGQTWKAVVISVDEQAKTYTAKMEVTRWA